MAAGNADLVIEPGADFATQIFWQAEQTGEPIHAQGPMDMDIIDPVTGQRLIRLDDGDAGTGTGNGGIDNGGAPYGIIQISIHRDATITFAPGRYVYDLYVYSVGPPLQRVRLLTGKVAVNDRITDLNTQMQQILSAGVAQPDINYDVALEGTNVILSFDASKPINQYDNPENAVPTRATLAAPDPNIDLTAATQVLYRSTATPPTEGPVVDGMGGPVEGPMVETWLRSQAVITAAYSGQTKGLIVTKYETGIFGV